MRFYLRYIEPNKARIDWLIQTDTHTLYLCEIKFSKYPIGRTVLHELEEKVRRLTRPKSFSVRTVLIHVNGVDESVMEHPLVDHVIDFSEMLS